MAGGSTRTTVILWSSDAAIYDARIRIVYVEASRDLLFAQNRERRERNAALPIAAIERMMDRWEVPDRSEAQEVEWWIDGHLPVLWGASGERPKRAVDPACSRLSELSKGHSAWLPARIPD